jgi:predicted ATPase
MFTDYIFPEAFTKQVGLKQATLRNLKSLVVLAGPNGAGKSRYLALVPGITERIPKSMKGLEARRQQLAQLAKEPNNPLVPNREAHITELEEEIRWLESIVANTRWAGEFPRELKTIALRYQLANKSLSNSWEGGYHIEEIEPDEVPLRKLEENAYANLQGGFSSAASSVPAYFHMVARAMYDSEHPLQKNSTAVKQRLDDALAFNRVLSAFFSAKVELKVDARGNPVAYFRGRPFLPKELSEGEQILVIWAILLHRQRAWLRGAQVLIDEPENHLHPDACIRALNALQSEDILGPEGQIWLATHSIPLIAYAGLDSVYLVDHGAIEYAGNKIEKVVERLMGGAEGSTRLRTLLADADELAFDAFAAQCLLPPDVAPPRKGDDQQAQMAKLAQQVGAHKENVRILDYAAGRGRLAVALKEAGLTAGAEVYLPGLPGPRVHLSRGTARVSGAHP